MVTGPVCNIKFEPADAVETVEHEGTTCDFCSQVSVEPGRLQLELVPVSGAGPNAVSGVRSRQRPAIGRG